MFVPRVGEEFGRYRLDRLIGQGGMGMVFAATDLRLHRTVALKVITGALAASDEFRDRFQHEAEALAQLDSPYVVTIHDHDEIDGTPYIVMQYVDGTDLSTRLRASGALPARTALQIAAQLARGLSDAHRRGVLHRDVKPANVLLRGLDQDDPHAYLCDFGIARSEGIDGPAPTATGMVAGTGSYLAPERADGHPATPASDLYALGCVLWVALTGSEPYSGTEVQIALAHQRAPVPQLTGTTPLIGRLNALFAGLLAKDPADRPDSATVRTELEALAAEAPTTPLTLALPPQGTALRGLAAPPPPPPPAGAPVGGAPAAGAPAASGSTRKRSRWPILVGVVAVLALVAGGLVLALTRGSDDADATAEDEDSPAESVAGDTNGDGYGDLQIHQGRLDATAPLSVWTLPSTGMQFGSADRVGALEGVPHLGDLDGDGVDERVWIDANTDDTELAIAIQTMDGDQSSTSLEVDPEFEFSGYANHLADVDGDGDDDLVMIGTPYGSPDVIFVALADDGELGEPTQWYQGGDSGGFTWSGDVDGDGADEVIVYFQPEDQDKNETLTVLDAEDAKFVAATPRELRDAAVNPYVTSWLIGDVDGDGTDELVVESGVRRGLWVYRFTDGQIGAREEWARTNRSREEARDQIYNSGIIGYALSDVDGDGDEDLIQVYEATKQETALGVTVRISDGESFADEVDWGSLECGEECDDIYSPLY
ncbi:serine/threonine-protein kinase [Nocardioides sambongensis]|uniref:serine/threonine-protein kinase n=1 Tax=Nocardioides sambongensis TaxID=2589074 RepID=UPI001128DD2B|nr:serine/threonine-protein kinase [Nocardioides sambongensis]